MSERETKALNYEKSKKSLLTFIFQEIEILEVPFYYNESDPNVQKRFSYWSEDIGLNLFHWHWHLVFPFDVHVNEGSADIVNKERRGESFYYMHNQVVKRYIFQPTKPLRDGYMTSHNPI